MDCADRRTRAVRDMVDADLSREIKPGTFSLIIGVMLFIAPYGLLPPPVGWITGGLLSGVFIAFAGWRAVRLLKAAAVRGDRDYDRNTKALLAKDYQNSESA